MSVAESFAIGGVRILKFSKVGVLLGPMALCGVLASSASAVFWHTNGVKAFSSTDAGISRLIIHHAGGVGILQCPTASVSGTINGPTFNSVLPISAATVTPVYGAVGNCTYNGVLGFTVTCSSAELRAIRYDGGDTLQTAAGGQTTGELAGIDCRLSAAASQCSTITGTVPVHYINPNPLSTGSGRLTITTAGQSVTVSKIGAGCAAIPHGSGTFGTANGAGIGDTTYTVHGPNAPYIYTSTT